MSRVQVIKAAIIDGRTAYAASVSRMPTAIRAPSMLRRNAAENGFCPIYSNETLFYDSRASGGVTVKKENGDVKRPIINEENQKITSKMDKEKQIVIPTVNCGSNYKYIAETVPEARSEIFQVVPKI